MGELKHRLSVWVPSQFGRSTAAHLLHHFEVAKCPLHACQIPQAKGSPKGTL